MWRFLVPYSRFKDWFSSPYVVVDMELVFHVMVWRVMGEGGGVLRWIVSFCVVFVLMGCIIVSSFGGGYVFGTTIINHCFNGCYCSTPPCYTKCYKLKVLSRYRDVYMYGHHL